MTKRGALVILIAGAVFLSACATLRKPDLSNLLVPVPSGSGDVTVGVIDMRADVMKGDIRPNRLGRVRKASLEWVDVPTQSGRPVADDLAASLARSLAAGGFAVRTVSFPAGTSRETALRVLGETGATRLMLLTIRDLEFEHYFSTRLVHDLTLVVERTDGLRGAEASTAADARIGTSGKHDEVVGNVETAIRGKLNTLLTNRHVVEALGG